MHVDGNSCWLGFFFPHIQQGRVFVKSGFVPHKGGMKQSDSETQLLSICSIILLIAPTCHVCDGWN
jgi:hypothetical protein